MRTANHKELDGVVELSGDGSEKVGTWPGAGLVLTHRSGADSDFVREPLLCPQLQLPSLREPDRVEASGSIARRNSRRSGDRFADCEQPGLLFIPVHGRRVIPRDVRPSPDPG